jgi:hypothetical protein
MLVPSAFVMLQCCLPGVCSYMQWLAWEVAMRQLLPPAYEDGPAHLSNAKEQQQQLTGAKKQQDAQVVIV